MWLAQYARRDARLSYLRLQLEQRAAGGADPGGVGAEPLGRAAGAAELPRSRRLRDRHRAPGRQRRDGRRPARRVPAAHRAAGHGRRRRDRATASRRPSPPSRPSTCCASYLRRYRDPGQALEELNAQLVDFERPEDFVSIFVAVFDTDAGTMRYASAGHPAGWHCSERVPHALRATGPLLMMEGSVAPTCRRSGRSSHGDMLLLSTDGLLEARSGDQFFGEDRVASTLRRDAGRRARGAVQDAGGRGGRLLRRSVRSTTSRSSPCTAAERISLARRPARAHWTRWRRHPRRRPRQAPRCRVGSGAGGEPPPGRRQARPAGEAVRARPASTCCATRARSSRTRCWPTRPADDLPADGVVTGVGEVDGRPVAVMANDPTVKAGSWGARTVEKIVRLTELALRDAHPDRVAGRLGRRPHHRPGRAVPRASGRRSDLLQPGAAVGPGAPGLLPVRAVGRRRRLHPELLRHRGHGRGQRVDVPGLAAHGRDGHRRARHARGDGRRPHARHRVGLRRQPRPRRRRRHRAGPRLPHLLPVAVGRGSRPHYEPVAPASRAHRRRGARLRQRRATTCTG